MKRKAPKKPKIRRKWVINPRTRVKESLKTRHKRAKVKKELKQIIKRIEDEPR